MNKKTNIFIKLRNEIIKLLMQADKDEEILSSPQVLRWVYILFSIAVFGYLINSYISVFYPAGSNYEVTFVRIVRIFDLCFSSVLLLIFIILMVKIYKYLIIKGRHLKLFNLLLYYLFGTYLFGKIYTRMYVLNQKLFNYFNPPLEITNVVQGGIKAFKLELDFNIYSFLTSFTSSYYKISPNNNLVSLINICQLIFTFFILTILISLFVQKQ